jgi:quercetin dioxygenase-like cupin family protein
MVNIQYFVDKMKAERDAGAGPSAGENPICGEVGARPRPSHSISKFASVVNAGCGVTFNLGGPKFEFLASPEESAYWVMKGTLPARVSVPLHSHGDAESFYLISGEVQFLAPTTSGLQWKTLRPGDFVHIPSDVKHAWRNLSTNPAEVLCATTPRLGRFLCEVGQFVRASGTDGVLNKLKSLSESYGYWMGSPQENADVGIALQ